MKKTIRKIICFGLTLLLCFSTIGCSNNNSEIFENKTINVTNSKNKTIKLGTMPGNEPMLTWIKDGLDPLGYSIEIIMFSANQLPATALRDGDIDGVILNQKHWLDKFNKENNSNLYMVEPYIYYSPNAVFSEKHSHLKDLPQNAQIAIPGDPTNMDRALLGLEKTGLIGLGEKLGEFYSIIDIEENPKNIEFLETERGTTARVIKDVDAVICGSHEAKLVGIDISKFLYDDFERYPHGLIIRSKKDMKLNWVKDTMKVINTDEYWDKFDNYYKGTYVRWLDK